jgi:PAS domain S-box-containing protein
MSGTENEPGLPVLASRLRPRVLLVLRLTTLLLALAAILIIQTALAVVFLMVLFVLLLLHTPAQEISADVEAASMQHPMVPPSTMPLIEGITRQLSSSLSVGQVAKVVLSAALRATHAEVATLAMPAEVDHFTTLQLRRGEDNVQIIQRPYTSATLIEQALQQGHNRGVMISRDNSGIAVMLRHEYLVIGALSVEGKPGMLDETQAGLLSEVAMPAAISLHNARLLDDQQYQIETLSHIQALMLRVAGAVDGNMVSQAILETTRDMLGAQEVALYQQKTAATGAELETMLSLHRDRFSRAQNEKRLTQEVALRAAKTGDLQISRQPVTCVAVPVWRDGEVEQVLAAAFIERHTLRQRDLNSLSLLAGQTAAHLDTVEAHEQIRDFSERLRATINSAQDGILLIDLAGKVVECNPTAERLLGIDKARFVGKPYVTMIFDLLKVNAASGLGYGRQQLPELARQLRYEPERVSRRQFDQLTGGEKRTLEEISAPMFDARNALVGRMLVLRDMSEQKRLNDFRSEVMRMSVHDLRGPLTAIINGIDMTLALGLSESPEDNERVLRLSLASANDLMRLINGLLELSRLESREMPIHVQSITAHELIEKACAALETSLSEAEIELEVALPDDLPPLHVDPDLMRRVFVNLIDNALRYTPTGKKILITGVHDDVETVTLSVADSGRGIAPEDREHIFEQYRQTENKPLRGSNGTGLGLSFCKLAVEANGGSIWAGDSDILPGAALSVRLPVVPKAPLMS